MNNGHQPRNASRHRDSELLAIPANTATLTYNHGLAGVPNVQAVLVCVTADQGYVPGEEVPLGGWMTRNSGIAEPMLALSWTATQISVYRNGASAQIWPKSGSAYASLTTARWMLKLRFWL